MTIARAFHSGLQNEVVERELGELATDDLAQRCEREVLEVRSSCARSIQDGRIVLLDQRYDRSKRVAVEVPFAGP